MATKDLTILLVHGAWGDGLHWQYVIPILAKAGYKVRAIENPLTSLEGDIQNTKDLIDAQEGQVLLVGHSYGGEVITGAGNHDKVVGLVYIAAFAPDKGENLDSILKRREPVSGDANIAPDSKGFLWINYDKFHESFCQDLGEDEALAFAAAQKPIHSKCFGDQSGEPAWKNKPTWYQVSDQDKMINPITQNELAARMKPKKIIHLNAGHASMASLPKEVSQLILEAARELTATTAKKSVLQN